MAEYENGHDSERDIPVDLPEIAVEDGSDPNRGGIPGLKNIFIQPNTNTGGPWDAIKEAMKGSQNAEFYLALTNVNEELIQNHMRVQFYLNIANYGDPIIEDIILTEYQMRRAINGEFMAQVVDMVVGERQARKREARNAANSIYQKRNMVENYQPGKLN